MLIHMSSKASESETTSIGKGFQGLPGRGSIDSLAPVNIRIRDFRKSTFRDVMLECLRSGKQVIDESLR